MDASVKLGAIEDVFASFDLNDLEVLEVAQGGALPGMAPADSSSSSSSSSCC